MTRTEREYDAVVIGAGPAGSTAAALLAERGRSVLVLERERFPRFHVGESLMPYTYFSFERLGVLDQLHESAFVKKHSVQFASMDGSISRAFQFDEHLDHPCTQTWQVLRSDFDELLLENARRKGAQVRQGVSVRELLSEGGRATGVVVDVKGGGRESVRSRAVIDASGRSAVIGGKMGWRKRYQELGKISIFAYFKGTRRDEGIAEGATTIAYIPQKGWFWYIALPDDIASIGVVAEPEYLYRETRDPEEIFRREADDCEWIRNKLASGTPVTDFMVTSEFSYFSEQVGGEGFCLTGDAYSFLDPVFASGVFLALKGGEWAADAVHAGLESGSLDATTLTRYRGDYDHALACMRRLIGAFYMPEFNFRDFVTAHPGARGPLVDALIGNLFADLGPLYQALADFTGRPELALEQESG